MTRRQGWLAAAVVLAGAAALLVWLQRDYTFVADEVAWVEWAGTESVASLLAPYNGNLHFTTLLVTRGLLEAFGTGYLAFSLFGVAGLFLCGGSLYAYCSRRLGYTYALVPVAIIALFGSGWAVLLQPLVGTVFLFSLGLGLLALLALERGDRRGDVSACLLLCAGLSFYSVGVAFLAAAAVALLLAPAWRRRAWVVLVPALLYGAWRLASGSIDAPSYLPQFGGELSNLIRAPLVFIDSGALVAQAILTGGTEPVAHGPATSLVLDGFTFGRLAATLALLFAEAAFVAVAYFGMRRRGGVPRSVWVAVAGLATLWAAQAYVLGEGRTPNESRYLFSGAFLLVVLGVEVVRALRPAPRVLAVGAAAFVIPIALNVHQMRGPHHVLEDYSLRARTDMAVIELASEQVDPGFTPQLLGPVVPPALYLTSGPWNEMAERHGSPSIAVAEISLLPERVRQEADAVLAGALGLRTAPSAVPVADCGSAAVPPQAVPPAGVVLRADRPALVLARRWAREPGVVAGLLEAGQGGFLAIPRDEAGISWQVATRPATPLQVCSLDPRVSR